MCGQRRCASGCTAAASLNFDLQEMGGNKEERVYRLMQTVVRRIREGKENCKRSLRRQSNLKIIDFVEEQARGAGSKQDVLCERKNKE